MGWRIQVACWFSVIGLWLVPSDAAEPTSINSATTQAPSAIRTSGGWKIVETSNFRCWSTLPDVEARQLAESCEVWRTRLRTMWISDQPSAAWSPKCEVYVHANRTAYNHALNRPGDPSVGSTMMNFDQGRTVMRRIDVRSDASDWSNAAIPHELTHVILGERFQGHALPRWADEGIAMLSESAEKHRERLTNLQEILAGRPTFTMSDLVTTTRLPAPHLRDAFYGQSIALSSLLVRKSTPAQFADFVEESMSIGFEVALKKHYKLNGLPELQREWNDWTKDRNSMKFVSLPIQIGSTPNVADAVGP